MNSSPTDGDDPWELFGILFNDCNEAARKLEQTLDMEIGRLEIEYGAEWIVYDPIANLISRQNGQITVDGLGKINASKPLRRGEIEYFDPRFAADYITMPMRISNIEKLLGGFVKERRYWNRSWFSYYSLSLFSSNSCLSMLCLSLSIISVTFLLDSHIRATTPTLSTVIL